MVTATRGGPASVSSRATPAKTATQQPVRGLGRLAPSALPHKGGALLNLRDAAAYLGLVPRNLWYATRWGRLPSIKPIRISNRLFWKRSELEIFVRGDRKA